jgi:hypothetical protein
MKKQFVDALVLTKWLSAVFLFLLAFPAICFAVPPTVTNVTATNPDGTYGFGATITITITLDQSVNVDTSGGVPQLTLELGNPDGLASYVSGNGTNNLTFQYTVIGGNASADLDYVGTNSLTLGGATIKNVGTEDANLTLP